MRSLSCLLFALLVSVTASCPSVPAVKPQTVEIVSGTLRLKALLWKPAGPRPFPPQGFSGEPGGPRPFSRHNVQSRTQLRSPATYSQTYDHGGSEDTRP